MCYDDTEYEPVPLKEMGLFYLLMFLFWSALLMGDGALKQ